MLIHGLRSSATYRPEMNVFRKNRDGVYRAWGSELVSYLMENGHPRAV